MLALVDPFAVAVALVGVNVLTFGMFGLDKAQARSGGWRISEANLLTLALIGGTPAAYLARKRFRHKTRKQPFSTQLALIAMGQVALGGLWWAGVIPPGG